MSETIAELEAALAAACEVELAARTEAQLAWNEARRRQAAGYKALRNRMRLQSALAERKAMFPPEGWVQHPTSPEHYYRGMIVKSSAELRAEHDLLMAAEQQTKHLDHAGPYYGRLGGLAFHDFEGQPDATAQTDLIAGYPA